MKLNAIEKTLMNNSLRSVLQRRYEAPLLEKLGGRLEGGRALELGCGQGVGTELIVQMFGAREVHALDLDADMVARARRRLSRYPAERFNVYIADATSIPEPDASFDAVFDFGILHHVPDWEAAVAEVARVLKPGGRFYFEEVTRQALDRWAYRTFLEHPREKRFTGTEFVAALEQRGIQVDGRAVERFFGDFVIGVGCKGVL
jgi:ubiquinone/menaquinone biosynthesis C-methylase UbiE